MSDLKTIIKLAAQVVLFRNGDVTTEDGDYATTDCGNIIYLEESLAHYFNLDSDDITFKNMNDLIRKIDEMPNIEQLQQRIAELEQRERELAATVERLRELRKLLEQKSNEIDKNRYMNGSHSEPIDPYLATELEYQYEKIEDEFDLVLSNLLSEEAIDEKNLNAVKREVYADGYYDGYRMAWLHDHDSKADHDEYASEQSEIESEKLYPSGKDGE